MRPAVNDASTGCEQPMETLSVSISVRNLPPAYTCDGEDKSPEIDVGGVNIQHSKCLAIICNDPDAPGGGGFVHWLAWNVELVKLIPEKVPKTPTVTFPITAVQGDNSFRYNRVFRPLPAPRTDAPLLLQGIRTGRRTRSCTRCNKRGAFACHGRACRPVW